jgi:hypothetical protein
MTAAAVRLGYGPRQPTQGGVVTDGQIDEGFFRRYRELLDAEDAAFDELEHAYEEGDRATFEQDLGNWRSIVDRRRSFLERHGFMPVPAT